MASFDDIGIRRPTIAKVRASIEKPRCQGLLTRGKGGNSVDDPLFAEYLAAQGAVGRARS